MVVSLNGVLQYSHIIQKNSECSGNALSFYFPGGLKRIVGRMKVLFFMDFFTGLCVCKTPKGCHTQNLSTRNWFLSLIETNSRQFVVWWMVSNNII